MKRLSIGFGMVLLAVIGIAACSGSNSATTQTPTVVVPEGPFTYNAYTALLGQHVDVEGMVNYKALKENRKDLDIFVAHMGQLLSLIHI